MQNLFSEPFVLIAILFGGFFIFDQIRRRQRASRLSERQQFSDGEFGRLFFPDPALSDIAVRARKVLADHLDMDLSGLRPEDKLDDDLNAGIGSNVELMWELEKEFSINFEVEDLGKFERLAASLTTFSDLVHAIAKRIDSTGQTPDTANEAASSDWHSVIGHAWFAGLGIAVLGSMFGPDWVWNVGLIIAMLPMSVGAFYQAGSIAFDALSNLREVGIGPAMQQPLGLLFGVFIFALVLAVGVGLMWAVIAIVTELYSGR